ncbi:hypothetical protein HYX17_01480 [Candidatus Woesearchaeota archaeon]|nr:hypothetical protein [Candidatus Woesearchaeota archaeon]
MRYKNILLVIVVLILVTNISLAYNRDPPENVHQYITNESQDVWKLIPLEIKEHLTTPLNQNLDSDFDQGNDIITGSGEEDSSARWIWHFWQVDNPNNGEYDDGLIFVDSSYKRALGFWTNNLLPAYSKGDIDEAYWYLGRIAHLLEDTSQPSHVLMDCHPGSELYIIGKSCGQSEGDNGTDDSVLEEYTRDPNVFQSYKGIDYQNQEYKFENLIPSFTKNDWEDINPRIREVGYPTGLFKLFWYTAQKSQYWASDNRDANYTYTKLDGGMI